MPKKVVLIKKVPKGSPAPAGYTLVRSLSKIDVYQKTDVIPVDTSTGMDDLAALFGSMGVKEDAAQIVTADDSSAAVVVQQLQSAPEDELIAAMSRLGMGGRRRKTRKAKKTRKH
jgi:hypothetical protein